MTRSWSVRLGAGATAIVAAGSAVLSWDALSWGAGQLGVDPRLSWLYPVVIDGTITVATVAALALRGARYRIRAYVWALLAGAVGASVVGNGAHAAAGSLIHVIGAAVPAVALAASLHLLVILVRHAPAGRPVVVGDQVRDVDSELAMAAAELTPLIEEHADAILAEGIGAEAAARYIDPDGTTGRPPARQGTARTRRTSGARTTARKRAANGTRADQMRALLAEPGGRALTGDELGARLGIDAGYARRLRAEVDRAESEPARRPRVVDTSPAAPAAAAQEA